MRKTGGNIPTVSSPPNSPQRQQRNGIDVYRRNPRDQHFRQSDENGYGVATNPYENGLSYPFPFQSILDKSQPTVFYGERTSTNQDDFNDYEETPAHRSAPQNYQRTYTYERWSDDNKTNNSQSYSGNRQMYEPNTSAQSRSRQPASFTDGIIQKLSSVLPKSEEEKKVEVQKQTSSRTRELEQKSSNIIKKISSEIDSLLDEREGLIKECRSISLKLKQRRNQVLEQKQTECLKRIKNIDFLVHKKTAQKSILVSSSESISDMTNEEEFKQTLSEMSKLKKEIKEMNSIDMKDVADDYVLDHGDDEVEQDLYNEMDSFKSPEWKKTNDKDQFSYIMDEIAGDDTEQISEKDNNSDEIVNRDYDKYDKTPKNNQGTNKIDNRNSTSRMENEIVYPNVPRSQLTQRQNHRKRPYVIEDQNSYQ